MKGRGRCHGGRWTRAALLAGSALVPGWTPALAVDATWVGNGAPTANEWTQANNWTGAALPTGTATFTNNGAPTTVQILAAPATIGQIQFNAGAPVYTLNVGSTSVTQTLTINGAGIVNNASTVPVIDVFRTTLGSPSVVDFRNSSSAANAFITGNGVVNFRDSSTAMNATLFSPSLFSTTFNFFDSSSAGAATISLLGGPFNAIANVTFRNQSTAAHGVFDLNFLSDVLFLDQTTAGNSQFTMHGLSGLIFSGSSTAGNATIITENVGFSGVVGFQGNSTAGNATITLNGGSASFGGNSTGGNARLIANTGGTVDFSGSTGPLGNHKLSVGSLEGAGVFYLGANELTIGSNNLSTTVSGVISDCGTGAQCGTPGVGGGLVKTGAGTFILAGNNTYTGPTTVNTGALVVDGSIGSSSLTTVNPGATLAGSGTVGTTAIAGGTLAPGSAGGSIFGPLTVTGSLTFTAASTYMIQVTPANAGRTNVATTATLNGATVNAVFLPGSYVDKQYTILHANGGVNGTFNPAVIANSPNIQSTLSYDANNAYLNIHINFATPTGPLTVNQQNVANALTNFFNTTGSIPLAFATLSPAGLTIASGELGTGVIQSSIRADDQFVNLLLDPFIAGRSGGLSGGGMVSSYADESMAYAGSQRTSREREAYAMVTKAPLLSAEPASRWSVWGAAYGGNGTTNGDRLVGSQDTTYRAAGIAAGADYKVAPDTLVGFALAGGGTSFSLANGLGSGSADLFQAGVFARRDFGPAYLSAALAYGWHDVTTNRVVALAGIDQLQGRFRADSFAGRFEGGYRYATPYGGITPYAALQAISFNLPNYAERSLVGNGQFALNYAAQTTTDTRTELGLRADRSFAVNNGVLTLRGRVAWAHDYNPDRAVGAVFLALPGAAFVVNGARGAPDSALITAAADMKWRNGFSLSGTFEGEFSANTTSYAGKAVARYAW